MAGQTIGSMAAVVRATAGAFDADLKQCGRSVDNFKSHIDSVTPKGGGGLIGSLLGGAAIGAGVAAFGAIVGAVKGSLSSLLDTIHRGDEIQDFAAQVGATTEELTGLRFAADISGSSAEKLDIGLQKMVQKIGDAREGSDETRLAFEALGLNVDKLAQKSAGEAFKDIAEAFKNIKSPADQAAFAVDIFGKSGAGLVNILREGREGVDALIDRGKELGVVMGDEQANALGDARNAIHELNAAWTGFKNTLAGFLAPAFTELVKGLTWLLGGGSGGGAGGATSSKPAAIEATTNALADLKKKAKEAEEAQKRMDEIMKRGADVTKSVREPLEIFNDTLADLKSLLDNGAINWQTFERAVRGADDALQKATESKEKLDRFRSTPGVGATNAELGGTAAFSQIQAAARIGNDIQKRQEELAKRDLEEQKRQTKLLQDIKNAAAGRPLQGADVLMGVISVDLMHVGQSSSSTPSKRSYAGVYQVEVDSATVGQVEVESDYRLPFYGSFFQFGTNYDVEAICNAKQASRVDGTRLLWTVEVTWETPDSKNNPNQQPNLDDNGQPTDDPNNWRDRWEWQTSKFTGGLLDAEFRGAGERQLLLAAGAPMKVRDIGSMGPPVNSAGMIFNPPVEREYSRRILRITKFRTSFPNTFDAYGDAVNSDQFTIRKTGLTILVDPLTAKLEPVTGRLQFWKATDGTEVPYVELSIELVIRIDGWRFHIPNVGLDRWQLPNDTDENGKVLSIGDFADEIGPDGITPKKVIAPFTRIKDTDALPINDPVMLDLNGQPRNPGSPPVVLEYRGYEEKPFASLGL